MQISFCTLDDISDINYRGDKDLGLVEMYWDRLRCCGQEISMNLTNDKHEKWAY